MSLTTDEPLPFFVYGTLRPGQRNYTQYIRGRSVAEKPASLEEACLLSLGSFPMAVHPNQVPRPVLSYEKTTIQGELIFPHPRHYTQMLRDLDQLEEYNPFDLSNSMYHRIKQNVFDSDHHTITAWVYMGNRRFVSYDNKVISNGDWVAFRSRRNTRWMPSR
jgi:gamma-glutamylcyclotransferase (GGCT)/AIG2-like uncharacterized protein YtfP